MTGLLGYGRVLVVTAVEAERQAVIRGLRAGADPRTPALEARALSAPAVPAPAGRAGTGNGSGVIVGAGEVVVEAGGVGIAAAAVATARHLTAAACTGSRFDAVLSAGIGGGFPGRVAVASLVLGDRSVAADLGAESADGFLSLDEMGFGITVLPVDPSLLDRQREALPDAVTGPVLTASTVTGTADAVARLVARYPDAAAEAMEGFGVATAAAAAGVPFGEVRGISNLVGPRDRAAWRIDAALGEVSRAFAAMAALTVSTGSQPSHHSSRPNQPSRPGLPGPPDKARPNPPGPAGRR